MEEEVVEVAVGRPEDVETILEGMQEVVMALGAPKVKIGTTSIPSITEI